MKKIYKKKSVGIKLSTTFINRTKCKFCQDFSGFIYAVRNDILHKDVNLTIQKFEYVRKNTKRMCDDYILDFSPKLFHSNSLFTYDVPYKGYNPRLHRLRNLNIKFTMTEFASCKCGSTEWAFNYRSNEKQPASNRKSDRINPIKFSY